MTVEAAPVALNREQALDTLGELVAVLVDESLTFTVEPMTLDPISRTDPNRQVAVEIGSEWMADSEFRQLITWAAGPGRWFGMAGGKIRLTVSWKEEER